MYGNNWNNNGNFNGNGNNWNRGPINTGYPQPGYNQGNQMNNGFNNMNRGMYQQQPQQQYQQPMAPTYTPLKHENEGFWHEVLQAILLNGLENSKSVRSNSKGYICNMKGDNFGLVFNLVYDLNYRYLEPFVYPTSEASMSNGGLGENIDDAFLSKATFLTPKISSIRQNYSTSLTTVGTIRDFMNNLYNEVQNIGKYIGAILQLGQVGQALLQQALMKRYSFGGINIKPTVVNNGGRAAIRFLYSLAEDITINMKQDQHFFGE